MNAVRIAGDVGGTGRFAVESGSNEGLAYVLTVSAGGVVDGCKCLGFAARKGCKHALAVSEAWRAEPRAELVDVLEQSVNALMAAKREREVAARR